MITLYPSVYAKFYEKYSTVVNGELKEYTHVYVTPEGTFLPGVTKWLTSVRNPEKAEKLQRINKYTLMYAAARGHIVHELCQRYDMFGDYDLCPSARPLVNGKYIVEDDGMVFQIDREKALIDAKHYLEIMGRFNVECIDVEYCVSNGTFASCIDCVYWSEEKHGFVLIDIKTTAEYHHEDVTDQLNIYRKWFLEQNPGAEVVGLYGIHLCERNNTWGSHECSVLPDDEVQSILDMMEWNSTHDKKDQKTWCTKVAPTATTNGIVAQSMVDEYYTMAKQVEAMNARMEQFKSFVKEKMQENGITSCDFGSFKFTLTPESESEVFDAAKFKKENPDLAKQYMKKQKRSAALRITLR